MNKIFLCVVFTTGMLLTGCAGKFIPDSITNADNNACRADLTRALDKILATQQTGKSRKEITDIAQATIPRVLQMPQGRTEGFTVDLTQMGLYQTTDVDFRKYGFTYKNKGDTCRLSLYSRIEGSIQYSNTITFIESEALPNCRCQAGN